MANARKAPAALWIAAGPLAVGATMSLHSGDPGGFLVAALAAAVGPAVGLFSGAPFFTAGFKLALLAGLAVSAGLIVLGLRRVDRAWGRLLLVCGGAAWTVCGAVGLGPQ